MKKTKSNVISKQLVITFAMIIALFVPFSVSADISTGLVAYYPFNGTAADVSGSGNNGTVYGATLTTDRFGNDNSAYAFNGSNNSYILVPHSSSLNFSDDFSISIWIYDQSTSFNHVLSKGQDIYSHYNLVDGGKFFSVAYDSAYNNQTSINDLNYVSNKWNFVTIVVDNKSHSLRFYKDGTLISEKALNNFNITTTYPLVIGRHFTCSDGGCGLEYPFTGKVDDVRIYNRALTHNEILSLYVNGKVTYSVSNLLPVTSLSTTSQAKYTFTNFDSTFHSLNQATMTSTYASDFTIANDTCSNQTIDAGGVCTLDIIFTPSATGNSTATLNISSGTDSIAIPLTGTGSTDIRGNVTNLSTGMPLSGATVTISGGGSVTTATDGSFTFAPVYGAYSLTLSKTGYNGYTTPANIITSATQGAKLKLGMAPPGLLNISTPVPLVPTSTFVDTIKITGGTGPYTFNLAYGNLPAGLVLDTALGTITGTPTTSGSHVFAIGVTDSLGAYAEREYTVNYPIITTAAYLPRSSQNVAYTSTIVSQGGVAPVTYSATTLPVGLTLNSTTGAISGTPTAVGPYSFDVTATDSVGRSYKKNFRMYVEGPLAIATSSLISGVVGSAYSQAVVGSGGFPPYSWIIDAGVLPSGLTFNTTTGVISGTPTAVESRQVAFTVHDYLARTVSKQLTINTYNPLVLAAVTLPRGTVGSVYSTTVTATGGAVPYGFAVTTGTLPTGLTLNSSTGVISGTPTVAGTSTFTITVTDAVNRTDAKSYTINVEVPISITISSLSNGLVGSVYSQNLTASGGLTPYSWSISSGNLPVGLSLNSNTGAINGTPSGVERPQFTLTVTDAYNRTATRSYTVDISNGLTLVQTVLPRGMQGVAYSTALSASGGAAPYSFSITSGALPTGVTLNTSTGVISGSPSVTATSTFTARVTDYFGRTDSKSFMIYVDPVFSITTPKLNDAIVNTPYNSCVPAPSGLVGWWAGDGNTDDVSGNGNNGVTAGTVTYLAGKSDQAFNFAAAGGVSINDTNLLLSSSSVTAETWFKFNGAYVGAASIILYKGNYDPYPHMAYSIEIDRSTNKIIGRSDSAGFSQILSTLTVNDNLWHYVALTIDNTSKTAKLYLDGVFQNSANFTGVIQQSTEPLSIGKYYYNSSYNFSGIIDETRIFNRALTASEIQAIYDTGGTGLCKPGTTGKGLAATGGLPPYTWSISSGVLPTGMVLDPATGIISGTPTVAGSQQIVVSAQDSANRTTTRQYTLTVTGPLTLMTTTMPNGAINEPYSEYMRVSGGTPPYTFTMTGQLPTGLVLNGSTGLISGTPTVAGLTNAAINVSDSSYPTPQALTSTPFSIRVWSMSTITTSAALPGIRTGQTMTPLTLVAKAGTAPYSWSLLGGTMPTGITISSSGIISGTPTTAGNYTFTIRATDSAATPANADKLFYLTVSDAIQISTQSISFGSVGVPFSHTLYAANGVAPYIWSITSGSLPAGLTLNTVNGVISGTPTAIGNSSVTFSVTDSDSSTQTTSKTLVLYIDPLTITTLTLPNGNQEVGYNANITTLGGIAPVAWSITTGTLPQGIIQNSTTGVISGITPYCGSFPVVIQAVDSASPQSTTSYGYTLNIACSPGYSVAGSIIINNGDTYILSSTVNLTIAVANNVLARQMRFSSDNATWSSWEAYATGKSINLSAGYGTKYVYVQVKDAADNVGTFVDDIYLRTFYPLTLSFAGTGGGSVNGGMSCVKGGSCPPQSFEETTQVVLTPTADNNSTFTSWSAACAVIGINCTVTMNSAKTATATFTEADKIRIGASPYTTMSTAFINAATGPVRARAIEFSETFNVALPTVFKGGWNAAFDNNIGNFTTLNGILTIGAGSLTVEGLVIR